MPAVSNILARLTSEVLQPAAQVVFAAGFLLFLWGLVRFMWNLSQGEVDNDGKWHMVYGVLGMVIMVSIWGIIALLDSTFGLGALNGNGAAVDPNRNQIQSVQFTL